MTIPQSPKSRNYVKKHMDSMNRPVTHKNAKDKALTRKTKHKPNYKNDE